MSKNISLNIRKDHFLYKKGKKDGYKFMIERLRSIHRMGEDSIREAWGYDMEEALGELIKELEKEVKDD